MSDTASSSRTTQPSPVPGDAALSPAETAASPSPRAPSAGDEQPTVISRRPPMPVSTGSDVASRISQGKIRPDDRLGHYDLVEYIGGGGMGRVFRAVDMRLARDVALKILSPDQAADEETLARFHNEARSAARLDHENIARVYYFGEDRGLHYIVFEYIEGANLRRLVERKGPLSLAEAVSYTLQIAEALAHAAGHDVVHRDIKPSNVLVTPSGRLKLIDMGLARLRRDDTSAADLTASGVTLGTFDYISPEQARDPRNADVRSDIYSLGCTLFYMLAGRPPFPEGTVLQKLLQHQGDQPPDVRQFRPELSDEAARVLRKMLAKDPRHRYRDPAELVEDLLVLADQVGLQPIGPSGRILVPPQEPKVSFLHRHLPWMAPVATLICIVFLLDRFWTSSAKQGTRPPDGAPFSASANPDHEATMQPSPGEPSLGEPSPGKPSPAPIQQLPSEEGPPSTANRIPQPGVERPGGVPEPDQDSGTARPAVRPPVNEPTLPDPLGRLAAGRPEAGGLSLAHLDGGVTIASQPPNVLSVASAADSPSAYLSGATAITGASNNYGPAPDQTRRPSGLLVVDELGVAAGAFRSLGAACSAATDGDTIELRFDGRSEERPIALANLDVTIRAGQRYHPVIVFRPVEADPVKYPRSMFTVTAGRLTLIDLALELYVPPRVPADDWSLFEIRGGQTVRLEKCSLSVVNASDRFSTYHREVAFFHATSVPGVDVSLTNNATAAMRPATIDLLDCIARGEAEFLRATDMQPVQLDWKNGLLVTTERLFSVHGGSEAPQPGAMLLVELQHVTAVTRSGFCRTVDTQLAPHQLPTQIHCADSILVGSAGSPLIEQIGVHDVDEMQRQVLWVGKGNFYQDFDVFWTICDLGGEPLSVPREFDAWTAFWTESEMSPQWGGVRWKTVPTPDRPLHKHTAADYTLSEPTLEQPNPAVGAAFLGRNAGFPSDRLPPLPADGPAELPGDVRPWD